MVIYATRNKKRKNKWIKRLIDRPYLAGPSAHKIVLLFLFLFLVLEPTYTSGLGYPTTNFGRLGPELAPILHVVALKLSQARL